MLLSSLPFTYFKVIIKIALCEPMRTVFVTLPYEEFLQIREALEDLDDLRELRNEREKSTDMPSGSLRAIGKELALEPE